MVLKKKISEMYILGITNIHCEQYIPVFHTLTAKLDACHPYKIIILLLVIKILSFLIDDNRSYGDGGSSTRRNGSRGRF